MVRHLMVVSAPGLTIVLLLLLCLQLPDQLEAQEGLISGWSFPEECLQGDGRGDAILQMKGYTELLRTKVTALERFVCLCVRARVYFELQSISKWCLS